MNLKDWNIRIRTLTIFRHILEDPIFSALQKVLESDCQNTEQFVDKYCSFVALLFEKDSCLSTYLSHLILNDENIVIKKKTRNEKRSKEIQMSLEQELSLFQDLSQLSSEELLKGLGYEGFLPHWEIKEMDLIQAYHQHLADLSCEGYGIFREFYAFGIQNNTLVPIHHPDPQKLSELVGYQREREQVIKNSLAFLEGIEVNNVLLYGDAGTGKSSTVKAIVNEYHNRGLRLIEVKKDQLNCLPDIMDSLADNPLHFILFIDDLSFGSNDDHFVTLKNILEGGIQHNHKNCVVYATSNRRHFVAENTKDREGSDLFRNDSIQETMSLAARFGLTVTFSKPLKDLYLEIVMELADRYEIETDREQLAIQAEGYAIRNSGRSPRTAKQFIEYTKINEKIK